MVRGLLSTYFLFEKKCRVEERFFPLFYRFFRVFICVVLGLTVNRLINFNRSSERKCSVFSRPFRGFRICFLELRATICRCGRVNRLLTFRSVVLSGLLCLFCLFLTPKNVSMSQWVRRVPFFVSRGIVSRRDLPQDKKDRDRFKAFNRRICRAQFACV